MKSAWLLHGSVAAVGSIVTGLLAAKSITHLWVGLETDKGWYCAQFDKPNLILRKFRSQREATECGKRGAGRQGDVNITVKESRSLNGSVNIGHLIAKMRRLGTHGEYDFILNNCQDFAKNI